MTSRFVHALPPGADGRRIGVFVVIAAAAFVLGFVAIRPPAAESLIITCGYYYMLGLFSAFIFYAWRIAVTDLRSWKQDSGEWRVVGLTLVAATLFAAWSDTFAHKLLFDEYVLQGTAWHMHATKEVATPIRAYDIFGTWLAIDTFLDKRPYFFTFLVSLLHDFTGFRLANTFALNVALSFLTLALTYWIVRALTARVGPSLLAVALLATLPLFGQNTTGASMELHNLAMIAVVMACAVYYLQAPNSDRASLLVLATALLAQCRYESVLFVVPVAFVIVFGWVRARRALMPWPLLAAPLFLVPYAWQDRFVASKPILWQLREGDTARFAWRYLSGNLEGARNFFFGISPGQPNSLWLTLLGLAGLVWALVRIVRRWRTAEKPTCPPSHLVVVVFALTLTFNLALLMFYYWSRLDEPVTARFALPFYFLFAILAGWFVHSLQMRRLPALRVATGGLVVWMLACGSQAYARRIYTQENLVMHELNWELEQLASRPGPLLVITGKATMPYLLRQVPAINTIAARARGSEIAWHMNQGTFRDVFIAQVLRPTSGRGEVIIDPSDELPANFHLEPLTKKRFGGRWIQISRVTVVEPESPTKLPGEQ
jgi:hypothetical protein